MEKGNRETGSARETVASASYKGRTPTSGYFDTARGGEASKLFGKVFCTQAEAFEARYEAYRSGLIKVAGAVDTLVVTGKGRKWRLVLVEGLGIVGGSNA